MIDLNPDLGPPQLPERKGMPPWGVAMVMLLITLVSFGFIAPFIALFIGYFFYSGSPEDYAKDLGSTKEQMRGIVLFAQGFSTLVGLAVIPSLFWRRFKEERISSLLRQPSINPILYILTAGIVISYLFPNSFFIEWNSNIDLPDGKFEDWLRSTEDSLTRQTEFLTSFSSTGQYLFGVLVIALLPAFGEELVFRGMLQPELQKGTNSVHAGIWIAAFFFSAFHFQFYGLVPRILLGALFGYLYYWSGSLYVPMFAHLVNNFFAVTAIYFGWMDTPGSDTATPTPPWYLALVATGIFAVLVYFFRRNSVQTKPNDYAA